jgi:flagellar capping protein FliD
MRGQSKDLSDLNSQIQEMQAGLNDKQAQLQDKYANLEATLGAMQSQGQKISGALATLSSAA